MKDFEEKRREVKEVAVSKAKVAKEVATHAARSLGGAASKDPGLFVGAAMMLSGAILLNVDNRKLSDDNRKLSKDNQKLKRQNLELIAVGLYNAGRLDEKNENQRPASQKTNDGDQE